MYRDGSGLWQGQRRVTCGNSRKAEVRGQGVADVVVCICGRSPSDHFCFLSEKQSQILSRGQGERRRGMMTEKER